MGEGLHHGWSAAVVSAMLVTVAPPPARGQGASRDLSAFSGPSLPFFVQMDIDSAEAMVVGVEEAPPTGWIVGAVSNSGEWDEASGKVKWGPFFAPSVPTALSYEITPTDPPGPGCFEGLASFDGADDAIGGDQCTAGTVPATSAWGVVCAAFLFASLGTALLRRSCRPTQRQ